MLVPVPDGVNPLSLASASDNLPDAWRAVGPWLAKRPGTPVLIVGGGARSIGLYAAGMAVALSAARVDYVDHDPERLAIAESLGACAIESRPGKGWFGRHCPPTRKSTVDLVVCQSSDAVFHCLMSSGVV